MFPCLWKGAHTLDRTYKAGFEACGVTYSQVALVVKSLPAKEGDIRDAGSIPGSGRCPGGGHGNPLQYSCLKNPMDRGAWWSIGLRRVRHDWSDLAYMGDILASDLRYPASVSPSLKWWQQGWQIVHFQYVSLPSSSLLPPLRGSLNATLRVSLQFLTADFFFTLPLSVSLLLLLSHFSRVRLCATP